MTAAPGRTVLIVGGGASGVLLAAHLLRNPDPNLRVTLLERQGEIGRGLAYSVVSPHLRVNVPARGMSAYADDPEHFRRYLARVHPEFAQDPFVFVPRRVYGAYLQSVLAEADALVPGRLEVIFDEATALKETSEQVLLERSGGAILAADVVLLALGHETDPSRGRGIAVRAGSVRDTPLAPDASVLILGSGLSMVDAFVSLTSAGHHGPITVVSRNGLLPKAHRDVPPLTIDAADVPFGTSLTYLVDWFRRLVAETEAAGGDWRSVVDGLRPYNQRLWQSWPEREKRQFLRHLRPWWNIHRHRLPPDLHHGLADAVADGRVTLVAAEFCAVEGRDGAATATIRARARNGHRMIAVARVYDCGGVSVDMTTSSNRLIQHLLATGAARPDPLHIGLDVDADSALVGADGTPSPRIRVVGPLTRGRNFEIEAVPDIRAQCRAIAQSVEQAFA